MSRTSIVLLLVVCLGGGCANRDLSWEFAVDPSLDAAVLVEARVREGGCDGAAIHEERFARGIDGMAPPTLEDGVYGFEIEVRDEACRVVGAGCEERTLPLDDGATVTVDVEPLATPREVCAPGETCTDGRCEGEDVDAGASDAGPSDAGPPIDAEVACDCEEPTDRCEAGRCIPVVQARTVAMGEGFGCAIGELRDTAGRRVYCWGDGNIGRLGTGCVTQSADPVTLSELPDEAWASLGVSGHACVRSTSGRLFCWGQNNRGQAGPMGTDCSGNQHTPTEIVVSGVSWADVGVASETTCGITDAGARICFGRSDQGRFGDDASRPSVTPEPTVIDDGRTWSALSGGSNGSFYGFADGAEAWFFGWNDAAQTDPAGGALGLPGRLGLGIESFGLGRGYGCAVASGGTLSCWGCSGTRALTSYEGCQLGGLGLGDAYLDPDPLTRDWEGTAGRLEVDLADVRSVGAHDWTCAVAAGRLHCWGAYHDGALGVGPLDPGSLPTGCGVRDGATYCATPQPVASTASDWVEVDVGSTQSCAIREGGRLYCWGWALGDRGDAPITEPTRMPLL